MQEEWREIHTFDGVDYKGDYEVSSFGRLKSNKSGTPKILKPCVTDEGYVTTVLSQGGKTKHVKLHRLVATHFILKEQGKNFVNHKDRVKSNNNVANLEWVSQSENCIHRHQVKRVRFKNMEEAYQRGVEDGMLIAKISSI